MRTLSLTSYCHNGVTRLAARTTAVCHASCSIIWFYLVLFLHGVWILVRGPGFSAGISKVQSVLIYVGRNRRATGQREGGKEHQQQGSSLARRREERILGGTMDRRNTTWAIFEASTPRVRALARCFTRNIREKPRFSTFLVANHRCFSRLH